MLNKLRFGAAAVAVVVLLAPLAHAQETTVTPVKSTTATDAAAARKNAQLPLKLQIVLARYQGDKKVSSVPYTMWVTTNEATTRLRMGLQVPVPTTTFGSANSIPVSSFNLKDVGTNIDCSATPGVENGIYKISLTVTDTSYTTNKVGEQVLPSFRNFTSTFTILLRDGQTAQYTSATDPVSGEVLKIDATLNVLK